jgi:HK97 family phage portal protein
VIVQSEGALQTLSGPTSPAWVAGGGLTLSGRYATYATIYRTQPNVRTVVDFLSRNIAQLGLPLFRRVSDDDRQRLGARDHGLVRTLRRPNPGTTRFRLFNDTVNDLGVYFNAAWLKIRTPTRLGLVRLPIDQVEVEGVLWPTRFYWTPPGGRRRDFAPSEVVYFSGYDPMNALMGLSPLETLRQVLAEEAAAGEYREHFWANAARMEGVIERPATAPDWDDIQRQAFRAQWQAAHAGGENSGKTAVLEDGMQWKATGFSMKASEYLGARKLTREEVAAAYHIPLPMVGILEHATFSNIKEQHKQLYQDSLGPWLVMIEEEIERQLLTDDFFGDVDEDLYVEFNIQEKLKGAFEEQADSIYKLVGGPIMTRNEGRARLNLSRLPDDGADRLITPLNVRDQPNGSRTPDAPKSLPPAAAADAHVWESTVRAFWQRQAARVQKDPIARRATLFTHDRWTRELATDLRPLFIAAGCAEGTEAERLARALAARINDDTRARLAAGGNPFTADRPVPVPRLAAAGAEEDADA